MRNSIGLNAKGNIGLVNSKGEIVCFGFNGIPSIMGVLRRDDVDEDWSTVPLETLLIPGEFL